MPVVPLLPESLVRPGTLLLPGGIYVAGLQLTLSCGLSSASIPSTTDNSVALASVDWPAPAPVTLWADTPDTFGASPLNTTYANRTITVVARTYGNGGEAAMRALTGQLEQICGLINASHAGTLTATFPNADAFTFDLLDAQPQATIDKRAVNGVQQVVTLKFTAKPLARGTQYTAVSATASNAAFWSSTFNAPTGDAPALGTLTVTPSSATQRTVWWGVETADAISTGTSSQLFWSAGSTAGTNLTATGVGALATIAGSYSAQVLSGSIAQYNSPSVPGTGSAALAGVPIAQLAGVHSGTYRVVARAYGSGTLGLAWNSTGATLRTQNAYASVDSSRWQLVDLGVVTVSGAWSGVINLGQASAVSVDYAFLVPTQAQGRARGVFGDSPYSPQTLLGLDGFGTWTTLATATTGGTWTEGGDATAFVGSPGSNYVQRVVSGASTIGRYATLNITGANQAAHVDTAAPGAAIGGVITNFVNASNFLTGGLSAATASGATWTVRKRIAGTYTTIATGGAGSGATWASVQLQTRDSGWWYLYAGQQGAMVLVGSGYDAVLDNGGALAGAGTIGLLDFATTGAGSVNRYANFYAWAPPLDAPAGVSQPLVIDPGSHTKAVSGSAVPLSDYAGDHCSVQQGAGRTSRLAVKLSRGVAGGDTDTTTLDTYAVRLDITPRFLELPH